jgi:hypothetical protein
VLDHIAKKCVWRRASRFSLLPSQRNGNRNGDRACYRFGVRMRDTR